MTRSLNHVLQDLYALGDSPAAKLQRTHHVCSQLTEAMKWSLEHNDIPVNEINPEVELIKTAPILRDHLFSELNRYLGDCLHVADQELIAAQPDTNESIRRALAHLEHLHRAHGIVAGWLQLLDAPATTRAEFALLFQAYGSHIFQDRVVQHQLATLIATPSTSLDYLWGRRPVVATRYVQGALQSLLSTQEARNVLLGVAEYSRSPRPARAAVFAASAGMIPIIRDLGLLAPLRPTILRRVQDHVADYVAQTCAEVGLDVRAIDVCLYTVTEFAVPRLAGTNCFGTKEEMIDALEQLVVAVMHAMVDARAPAIVDMVVDLGASEGARSDLKIALEATKRVADVAAIANSAMTQRFAHLGQSSTDLLFYLSNATRLCQYLDASGELFAAATPDLAAYFRTRTDAMPAILEFVLGSGRALLAESHGRETREHDEIMFTDTIDFSGVDEDASTLSTRGLRAPPDTLSLVLNVYSSKDVFMNVYRAGLADRILKAMSVTSAALDVKAEKDVLSKLRVRFGAKAVVACDDMIRDLEASQALNVAYAGVCKPDEPSMIALVVSDVMWPEDEKQEYQFHPGIQRAHSHYLTTFQAHRPLRNLEWLPHHGHIVLEVTLDDGVSHDIACMPTTADVFLHLQDLHLDAAPTREAVVTALAAATHSTAAHVRTALDFWVTEGFLDRSTYAPLPSRLLGTRLTTISTAAAARPRPSSPIPDILHDPAFFAAPLSSMTVKSDAPVLSARDKALATVLDAPPVPGTSTARIDQIARFAPIVLGRGPAPSLTRLQEGLRMFGVANVTPAEMAFVVGKLVREKKVDVNEKGEYVKALPPPSP
ncbi:hypothetical protein AMAG_00961 [Allomyces macrogynus ATCC 38327]|uniref:Cullin family profile domain-containing protein n=1 Tax=Allomyces macrogynus (strain ATCC 38327) TaxID=578462 RepID=A0A0L0RY67_ALLM3|nr:hypothetical protein AMAG_00961 [Allomyces macrogynus ATCC 38327]|eukprot:KNE55024.1 hypothetical protein AMAG_00961 [Allomyces macrogynus ATCC 38327]